jgi:multicomponent Na+:H+ antiporter subunit F
MNILMLVLVLCCFLCLYRILRGESAADRAVAVDILGIVVVGFAALLALKEQAGYLMDIAIAWTLQSFIAVIALAKYLEGKHFDE